MKVAVNLPHHHYELWIEKGSLNQVGAWVQSLWAPRKVVIITDDTVNALHGDKVSRQLEKSGFDVLIHSIKPGENSKNLISAANCYECLAEFGMTRHDGVLALGGGVVGDLAGFVSSTYMRGLSFLQIPTTLLAQVDSSVGGKTAVNTLSAKNLVGTFAQPNGVLIDPETLLTLEPRRIREGLAEIIKCGAISDIELWQLLDKCQDESEAMEHAVELITRSIEVKRKVVEEDEFDYGSRLTLNFGHTIAHAIEQSAGFGVVTHGEAVAIGMCQINKVSEAKGETAKGTTLQLVKMLSKFHLPVDFSEFNQEKLFKAVTHDKKARGSQIKIILLEEIGTAKIKTINMNEFKEFLI
ncbi:3-dehydroquinate synthase [Vagococcus sp.]|uniref:3-dehydroquinate synthase n=1 Tax=Vagococcus sp. TaxID=1933889 RepID=UPI003F947F00